MFLPTAVVNSIFSLPIDEDVPPLASLLALPLAATVTSVNTVEVGFKIKSERKASPRLRKTSSFTSLL